MHEVCRVLQIFLSYPDKIKTKVDFNVLCIFSSVAFWVQVPIGEDTLFVGFGEFRGEDKWTFEQAS